MHRIDPVAEVVGAGAAVVEGVGFVRDFDGLTGLVADYLAAVAGLLRGDEVADVRVAQAAGMRRTNSDEACIAGEGAIGGCVASAARDDRTSVPIEPAIFEPHEQPAR